MPKFNRKKINQISAEKIKLWKTITIISIVLFLAILCFSVNYLMLQKGIDKKIINKIFNTKELKKDLSEKKENKEEEIDKKFNEKCSGCIRRNIDGIYVLPKMANLPMASIMIDNHFSARPVIGLNHASLVYEAEVEGNFTRYMAIFDSNENVKKIGPVRSARPYFIDWARELSAVYAHCGGSPESLVQIIQKNILNLNEFYNGRYFWRDKDRSAPHNIITSMDNINKFLKKEEKEESNFTAWKFKDDSPSASSSSLEIKINFNHPDFKASWKYNEVDNDYIRYQTGRLYLTADNDIISAKNIIIQKIPAEIIDEKLRLKMNTAGEGEAIICLDGECKDGKWEKANSKARTIYYYEDETEVEFNAGPTWVEVVNPEIEIEINS